MAEIVFKEGDLVDWDYLESRISDFLRLYGKGPFYVFLIIIPIPGDRDFRNKIYHSQLLILSRDKEGKDKILGKKTKKPIKFSGEFFRKLSIKESEELLIDNAIKESEEIGKILTTVIKDSQFRIKLKGLKKIEGIYHFCLGFDDKEREFLTSSESSGKASLINDASKYLQEIVKILEDFMENEEFLNIKKIYNYVKRIIF